MYYFEGLDHLVDGDSMPFLRAYFMPRPFPPHTAQYFTIDLRDTTLHLSIHRGFSRKGEMIIPFPTAERAQRAFYRTIGKNFRKVPKTFPMARSLPPIVPITIIFELWSVEPDIPSRVYLVARDDWPFPEDDAVKTWIINVVSTPSYALELYQVVFAINDDTVVGQIEGQFVGRIAADREKIRQLLALLWKDPELVLAQIIL